MVFGKRTWNKVFPAIDKLIHAKGWKRGFALDKPIQHFNDAIPDSLAYELRSHFSWAAIMDVVHAPDIIMQAARILPLAWMFYQDCEG
jgi:hypothetical protein